MRETWRVPMIRSREPLWPYGRTAARPARLLEPLFSFGFAPHCLQHRVKGHRWMSPLATTFLPLPISRFQPEPLCDGPTTDSSTTLSPAGLPPRRPDYCLTREG